MRAASVPACCPDQLAYWLRRHGITTSISGSITTCMRYAVRAAQDVAGPLGIVFLRAATMATRSDQARSSHRYMARRGAQLQEMLDRAAARGEPTPTLVELLEVVLAPLYFHALFFNRPADADHARTLVDRLLTLASVRRAETAAPST